MRQKAWLTSFWLICPQASLKIHIVNYNRFVFCRKSCTSSIYITSFQLQYISEVAILKSTCASELLIVTMHGMSEFSWRGGSGMMSK
jgi:hypothetical protein